MADLLRISDLSIEFPGDAGVVRAVRGVDLAVAAGEVVALVGESGSGKSVTARAVLGLLSRPGRVSGGRVEFRGEDVLRMDARALRRHRGTHASMVFQDPLSSLDPLMRIGAQIEEAVRVHRSAGARERAVELMRLVGIPDPERRLADYPHHYSGGMRQRVMVAIALAGDPELLVADEPTTALDVTVQAQVLDLFARVNETLGTAILLITHNLGIVAGLAQRLAVMYAGRVVETGPVRDVFADPRHPYTRGLLASVAALDSDPARPLPSIPGRPPDLRDLPPGCAYEPRCRVSVDRCHTGAPPLLAVGGTRSAACLLAASPLPVEQGSAGPTEHVRRPSTSLLDSGEAVLRVEGVRKEYRTGGRRRGRTLVALDGVDLMIAPGETLGLVGESGCGKSTLARLVMRIEEPTAGVIELSGAGARAAQLVFQDPYASLNPRHTIAATVGEPLRIHGLSDRVDELLHTVGLDPSLRGRYPRELSGGQRQRVAIARALALDPRLLVLDEPVSSLDVSMQAQIVNLLREIRGRLGVSALFIAHDIAMVRHLADRIAVMYLGAIVEEGPSVELTARPRHPYTAGLIAAVPVAEPVAAAGRERALVTGELPSPLDPPTGCRFHPRCPIGPQAKPDRTVCTTTPPPLASTPDGRRVACHFAGEI